jgi:hypothetical protein
MAGANLMESEQAKMGIELVVAAASDYDDDDDDGILNELYLWTLSIVRCLKTKKIKKTKNYRQKIKT